MNEQDIKNIASQYESVYRKAYKALTHTTDYEVKEQIALRVLDTYIQDSRRPIYTDHTMSGSGTETDPLRVNLGN